MIHNDDVTFDKIKESNSLKELYDFKMKLAEDICNIQCQLRNSAYYKLQDEVYGKTSDEDTTLKEEWDSNRKNLALEKKIAQEKMVEASIGKLRHLGEVADFMTE